jgi:3-oxoacyl-[acyl-carrier-protein] synthase-1
MTTSIGMDVVSSCAAARAGLSRRAQLELREPDLETLESVPLKGHAVQGLTDGFDGTGRLMRLGDAALADLLGYSGLTAPDHAGTGFILCLPGDFYATSHAQMELLASEVSDELAYESLAEHLEERGALRERMERRLVTDLLALHGLAIEPRKRACLFGGAALFARAAQQAVQWIRERRVDRCIVGGIDSYVYGEALNQVHELGLIRTPQQPTGFFPGEAAAFVLLERAGTARARQARIEGVLASVAMAEEPFDRFSEEPPLGAALFSAVESCLGTRPSEPGLVIVNLNGDDFRANDFGNALSRMAGAGLPRDLRQWHPVEHFGELGAATGAASVCMGVRGFVRGHARSRHVLVALLADDEARGALLLDALPLTA